MRLPRQGCGSEFLPLRFQSGRRSIHFPDHALCFAEKVRDSGSSQFVCYPTPSTCVRTKTSCARHPNSILVFFHFPSYLTCPSLSLCLASEVFPKSSSKKARLSRLVAVFGVAPAKKAAVITPAAPKLAEASYAQCVPRLDTGDRCTPAWRRDRPLQAGPPEPRLPR